MARHFKQAEEPQQAQEAREAAPRTRGRHQKQDGSVPAAARTDAVAQADAGAARTDVGAARKTASERRRSTAPAGTPASRDAARDAKPAAQANKRRKTRRLLSNLLILAGVALLAIAGFLWGQAQWRYREQDKVNKKLQAYVTVSEPAAEASEEAPRGPQVDWEGLKAVNADVVGWLQIPDTEVNYPVYQGKDNDYYLHNTAEGNWTVGGQLFMDCDGTAPGMVDPQTLVYGHHLIDGTMFKKIAEMDDQAVFDGVDTVWYVTEQATYECEPLLLFYTTDSDQDARTFTFKNKAAFHTYLQERLDKAVTKRSDAQQAVDQAQHVLSLVTCNYYDGYGRTVLMCVPKDEVGGAAE